MNSSSISVPAVAVGVLREGARAVRADAAERINEWHEDRRICAGAWQQCSRQWDLSDVLGAEGDEERDLDLPGLHALALHEAAQAIGSLLEGWLKERVPDAESAERMRLEIQAVGALAATLAPIVEPIVLTDGAHRLWLLAVLEHAEHRRLPEQVQAGAGALLDRVLAGLEDRRDDPVGDDESAARKIDAAIGLQDRLAGRSVAPLDISGRAARIAVLSVLGQITQELAESLTSTAPDAPVCPAPEVLASGDIGELTRRCRDAFGGLAHVLLAYQQAADPQVQTVAWPLDRDTLQWALADHLLGLREHLQHAPRGELPALTRLLADTEQFAAVVRSRQATTHAQPREGQ